MPTDKAMSDAMLGTFRNMVKECKDKNLTGEAFDKMFETLQKMEQYAEEMNDFAAYSAKLTTEGLMNTFSQYYGEVLANAAKEEYKSEDSEISDEKLMENTLRAYEDFLKNLKGTEQGEKIIPAIEKVLELGRSGIPYPEFLIEMVIKGLDRALEGQVAMRDGIVEDLEWAKDSMLPVEVKMHEEILKAFDDLTVSSPFGLPDSFEHQLKRIEIEWKYKPEINKWHAVISRWQYMLEMFYDWLDAYCSFAPYDERWRTPGASEAQVKKNIKFTKECSPGFFKERERIFLESFGLKWEDIFEHETFINERKANRFEYSDERFDLIKRTYEYCKPFNNPPKELIDEAEKLHDEKRIHNPNRYKIGDKAKKEYEKRFGKIE
ncbi:MAG: hypothetical protein H8D45_17120 [Bacteroidetes bacterium]|nr:hypothetical protein [Bacteroidota bacterium]